MLFVISVLKLMLLLLLLPPLMLAKVSVAVRDHHSSRHLSCSWCVQAQAASWPSWFQSRKVVRSRPCWSGTSWSRCTSPSAPATCRSTWAGRRSCSSPSPSSSSWSSPSPGWSSTTSRGSATPAHATATRYERGSAEQTCPGSLHFVFVPSASCEVLWSELTWQLAEQKQGRTGEHISPQCKYVALPCLY